MIDNIENDVHCSSVLVNIVDKNIDEPVSKPTCLYLYLSYIRTTQFIITFFHIILLSLVHKKIVFTSDPQRFPVNCWWGPERNQSSTEPLLLPATYILYIFLNDENTVNLHNNRYEKPLPTSTYIFNRTYVVNLASTHTTQDHKNKNLPQIFLSLPSYGRLSTCLHKPNL